jgi:hypothetical protein
MLATGQQPEQGQQDKTHVDLLARENAQSIRSRLATGQSNVRRLAFFGRTG